jgi:hypothetical protein
MYEVSNTGPPLVCMTSYAADSASARRSIRTLGGILGILLCLRVQLGVLIAGDLQFQCRTYLFEREGLCDEQIYKLNHRGVLGAKSRKTEYIAILEY